jgi:extradiol dioxygenase family protein
MSLMPFHLSVPITDLPSARRFYGELLGCTEGRSAEMRCDFNFFGHHLVAHVEPKDAGHKTTDIVSAGVPTPCRHFGVVVPPETFAAIEGRLRAAGANFYFEPQTVFPGDVKEQRIMLVHDGCGNIVEFKATPPHGLFARSKGETAQA